MIAVGIILAAPRLSSVTNSDQSSFLPSSAESAQAAALAKREFPASTGATGVIVVKRADGAALTGADLRQVGALAQRLNSDKPAATRGALFDPTQTVAPNRQVAMVAVQFTGAPEQQDVRDAVVALRHDTNDALSGTDLRAGMTGQAAITVDNKQAFADAEKIVTAATLALIVVLLLLIFRSPIAALLPLLTVGLVFGVASSLVATAAHVFDFQVGQELPTMLTVVLFGIGTDYILFLLFRYRERLRAGDQPRQAIVAAVERVGEAIFSAAFAVIAAFGALVLAALGFFRTLGPGLAIGVAVMLLAALTLVPAVIAVLGRRVFWPSKAAARQPSGTHFAGLGRLVARRPLLVVISSLVVLGALAAGAFSFKPNYDPISQLPSNTEATRVFDDLKRGFPAGALAPTDIYLHRDTPFTQAELGAYVRQVAVAPGVASPMKPSVSADGRTAQVPVVITDAPYSTAGLDTVSGPLRDAARAAAPAGTQVLVGGPSMAFADVRATTDRDLKLIFPVAAVLFLLILALMLRAALAPVYLVAMVGLGFAATLGAAVLVFQHALGHAGLQFALPIILYLFVTAIGTDYNILITARLREEVREGRTPREAAALAIEHAGPSIGAAALILAGTFASLLVSGVPLFLEIGFGVTLGILLVAFVVSILLVPATTALLGHAAWWPGHKDRADVPALDREPVLAGERR
ncbi:MAG TPA: MMPL family transporter [Micromonosporaceae bacterium]